MKYIKEFREIGWRSIYGHSQFNKEVKNDLTTYNHTNHFSSPGQWTWVGNNLIYIISIKNGKFQGLKKDGSNIER